MSAPLYHWMHKPQMYGPSTPYKCGAMGDGGVTGRADVTCADCLTLMGQPEVTEQLRRDWTVAAVGGDTDLSLTDWLKEKEGGRTSDPLHKPPRMENPHTGDTDGVFIFYDVDYHHTDERFRNEYDLEVVPQSTGNVEITCGGTMITLHHLDRADLIRALLHDFHYSREIGGPGDDQL